MSGLVFAERPAAGEAAGLLVLHHGRGADEHDLLGLADVLDPARRLHVVTPGGPLRPEGWGGRHWYQVPRVGYPSGFIPTVEAWQPDVEARPRLRGFVAHGRQAPIIGVDFARRAVALLRAGGIQTEYLESDAAHHIDPAHLPAAVSWLGQTLRIAAPDVRDAATPHG